MRDTNHTICNSFLRTLFLVVALGSPAVCSADWGYDFDGGAEPSTWTTISNTEPVGSSSPTFLATIESGYLRMSDTTPANADGTFSGFAGTTGDIFKNVTVAADVNVATDTEDDLGVVARADLTAGSGYYGHVDYENGQACITKIESLHVGADLVCTAQDVLSVTDAHHIELSANGSVSPTLELLVFDATGANLLESLSVVDDGSVFGSPFQSGVSGAFIVPKGTTLEEASATQVNGTFDNINSFAVPEPTSFALCFLACLGVLAGRKRRS